MVTYLGADGALIDAAVAAGARGIVSAGTGAGYPTPLEVEALERGDARGRDDRPGDARRRGPGAAIPSLVTRGWIAADDLQPWKARILLRLALAAGTTDRAALQALFEAG